MPIRPVGYGGAGWSYGGKTYKPLPVKPPPVPRFTNPLPPITGSTAPNLVRTLPGNPAAAIMAVPRTVLPQPAARPPGQAATQSVIPNPNEYIGEIESDPEYLAGVGRGNAARQMALTNRQDAIRQAVIAGGWDPTPQLTGGLAQVAGDIDPTTQAAAAANQMSQRAQLQQALNRGLGNLPYDLAARGAARSGAAATGATALNEAFQTQTNTGMQDLLESIRGSIGTYTGALGTEDERLANLRSSVAQRLAQIAGYSRPTDEGDIFDEGPAPEGPGPSPEGVAGTAMTPVAKALARQRAAAQTRAGYLAPNPVVTRGILAAPRPAARPAARAPVRRIGP